MLEPIGLPWSPSAHPTTPSPMSFRDLIASLGSGAALLLLLSASANAANPPSGSDATLTLSEDTPFVLRAADFGFADPGDSPPHRFGRLKITTMPSQGSLQLDGLPLKAGDIIPMTPIPGIAWNMGTTGLNWWRVASSADGTKLAAVQLEGRIYTSSDSGGSWTARESMRNWVAVTSSADGTKLAATVRDGQIYTSNDSGVTWTPRENNRSWRDIASSSDGTRLVALVNGGRIHTSTDSGVSWTPRESSRAWVGVATSSDGSRLVAFPYGGGIYHSMDFGVTWVFRGHAKDWYGVASSADGTQLVGVVDGGAILFSRDFGVSWTGDLTTTPKSWRSVSSSANGSVVAAAAEGPGPDDSGIYVSTDSGKTWVQREFFGRTVTSSADGSTLVALDGQYGTTSPIRVSRPTLPQFVFTPQSNTVGSPYTSFTFQVEDDGPVGSNLDPTPNLLTLNVTAVNDSPQASGSIPDQTPVKGVPFNFEVPLTSFSDVDTGTILSFAAAWENGQPLPSWLQFDPATRTFSGTPGDTDEGTFQVTVTATDNGNPPLSASSSFYIRIPTDAPAGTNGSVVMEEDVPYTFRPTDFGFTDPDDSPPNQFVGITLTSLPETGKLTIEGSPVDIGDFISMLPEPELNWTPRESPQAWVGVASSSDGMKLAAITSQSGGPGRIFHSSDGGSTWTPRESPRPWRSVASSADGTRLVAVAAFEPIFTSSDSGLTWTARSEARNWTSVASSADGNTLAATVMQGQIYLSSDAGLTWAPVAESRFWQSISCSADGTRLAAAPSDDQIYVSHDSGASWTPQGPDLVWRSVAFSADGQKLVAAALELGGFPGRLYTSHDAGLTWKARDTSRLWKAVASSADGSKFVAVASLDRIYVSDDYGVTWRPRESAREWSACATSSDGTRMIAAASSATLFTSVETIPELVFTPAKNSFASPYASFSFQVEDAGTGDRTRDPVPKTLTLNVTPVNDAPTVAAPIPDQSAIERSPFTFQFAAGTFKDVESGDRLTYSARQANGNPLPPWLTFTPATRRFSGTPSSENTGRLELAVTATDDGDPPMAGTAEFSLSVVNLDEAPAGADQLLTLPLGRSYAFSPSDFGFSDPGDSPANAFLRVKLTTLPSSGQLTINGMPALAEEYAAIASAPLGSRWIPRATTRPWQAIACSLDGTKWVAVENFGRIFTSADAGETWTPRDAARAWYAVTSDAAGVNLAAAVKEGQIYTSNDSGVTWTPRAFSRSWSSIASSSDGSKLAAVATGRPIYLSSDFGVTWTQSETSRLWYSISSSSDGTRLAAAVWNGQLFTSANGGLTWSARESTRPWWSITSSADGTALAAVVENGRIFTSTDAGLTWTARESNRKWSTISSSADGTVLAAAVRNGRIYTSIDAGNTWKPREGTRQWNAVAVSADASTMAAAGTNSQIFTSTALPAQSLVYSPATGGGPAPSAEFTFQVEDDGAPGNNLDPSPNRFTLAFQESPFQAWTAENGLSTDPASNAGANLILFAFGLPADRLPAESLHVSNETIIQRGLPSLFPETPAENGTFGALFARRKNSGLVYQVEFSAALRDWETSQSEPVVLADDGLVEACLVQSPPLLGNGQRPRYFRVTIADGPIW